MLSRCTWPFIPCVGMYYNAGCQGGNYRRAWMYIMENGISSVTAYPYISVVHVMYIVFVWINDIKLGGGREEAKGILLSRYPLGQTKVSSWMGYPDLRGYVASYYPKKLLQTARCVLFIKVSLFQGVLNDFRVMYLRPLRCHMELQYTQFVTKLPDGNIYTCAGGYMSLQG